MRACLLAVAVLDLGVPVVVCGEPMRRRRDRIELDALRVDVAIIQEALLDHDRRLRALEHGTTWPADVTEFHRHVTHDHRGVEVVG